MVVRRAVTFERFAKRMRQLPEDINVAVTRGVAAGMKRGEAVVAEEIMATGPAQGVAGPPVNTKELILSIRSGRTRRGWQLWLDAPHAVFMELGTRPHIPPILPLYTWALQKFGADEREAKKIAYAVRALIAERGTAPRHFFKRAWKRIMNDVIPREIRREMRNLQSRKRYAARKG